MKKINKIIFWIVGIIFVIFILVNIAVSLFAKQMVAKQIEQALRLPTTLESISVSFPFSVDLNHLSVGSLFKADKISVSPNMLGFLAGKIVLNDLTLVNPVVNLEQYSEGGLNLSRLKQGGKPPEIYLTGLNIKNGKVTFTDKKIDPAGYKIILGKINAHISKVMLPLTSLKANFKLTTDILAQDERKLGSLVFNGWLDYGLKDMDAVLTLKDLDLIYFSPYYGDFISSKKLLSAKLNCNTIFNAQKNNLNILTEFKLSNLTYAQQAQTEGELLEVNLTKNALDFFTDRKGNLNLEFELNTRLDQPRISVEQLKKIILKAAAKNLANQSPENLIQKVSDNIEQFKALGKSLKNIFGGKN